VSVLEGPPDAQKVNTRQVKIGLNNHVQAQVLEGLKEGELVVVGEASAGSGSGSSNRRPPGMF
jgi:macrolide-specific efflux system membrane fusion protein